MRRSHVVLVALGLICMAATVLAESSRDREKSQTMRFDLPTAVMKRQHTFYLKEGFSYDFVLRVERAHWDNMNLYRQVPIWINLADPEKPYGDPVVVPTQRGQGMVWFGFEPPRSGNFVVQAGTSAPAGCLASLEITETDLRVIKR